MCWKAFRAIISPIMRLSGSTRKPVFKGISCPTILASDKEDMLFKYFPKLSARIPNSAELIHTQDGKNGAAAKSTVALLQDGPWPRWTCNAVTPSPHEAASQRRSLMRAPARELPHLDDQLAK